jgi:hypothetical protein
MFYANSSHGCWFLSGSVRAVGVSTVPQTVRAGSGVGVGVSVGISAGVGIVGVRPSPSLRTDACSALGSVSKSSWRAHTETFSTGELYKNRVVFILIR